MLEFPKSIKDGDIELVKLEPTFENTKIIFDLINKDREYIGKWLGWVDYIQKAEDEFLSIKDMSQEKSTEYFIKYKDKIVGAVGFHTVKEKNRFGEIGYWLGSDFNGLGIMTKAVKIFESFAFDKADFNRIEIRMDTENKKSESIAKRLGYHLDGELRQDELLKNGSFRNTYIYSKLKSEWEKENKNA